MMDVPMMLSRVYDLLVRKETGLLAIALVLFTLVKTWLEIRKLRRDIPESEVRLKKLVLDTAETQVKSELAVRELRRQKGHHPEILEVLVEIQEM